MIAGRRSTSCRLRRIHEAGTGKLFMFVHVFSEKTAAFHRVWSVASRTIYVGTCRCTKKMMRIERGETSPIITSLQTHDQPSKRAWIARGSRRFHTWPHQLLFLLLKSAELNISSIIRNGRVTRQNMFVENARIPHRTLIPRLAEAFKWCACVPSSVTAAIRFEKSIETNALCCNVQNV